MKLYPPGGGVPVVHHETNIEFLLSQGWTKEKPKAEKPKKHEVNQNG